MRASILKTEHFPLAPRFPQTFDGQQLIQLIKKLVTLDKAWIPSEPGHSLYIRPALIGTQAALGVGATTDALLFVISSPVGPYYKTGFKPVALEADPARVRAWPGGTGQYKLGGNYAPGIRPQMEAAVRGYQQNLWLFGEQHWLTEVGTMNLFVVLRGKNGGESSIVHCVFAVEGKNIAPTKSLGWFTSNALIWNAQR